MKENWIAWLARGRVLRRPIGVLMFVLAVIGTILPIMPTWPFLIPAIVLLGRRDPMLRHTHLMLRHGLRRMRRARTRWLRSLGLRGSAEYVRARRMITPIILQAERTFSGRAAITSR